MLDAAAKAGERAICIRVEPGISPLGICGIGEGGVIPTVAIVNVAAQAIEPTGSLHVGPLFTLPLRPGRVYEACRLAKVAQ